MIRPIAGFIVFTVLVFLHHRGKYPPGHFTPASRKRELFEAAVIVLCILALPFVGFNFLGYTGWLGPYLLLGLLAPIVLDVILRKRGLKAIGLILPTNRRALVIVAILLFAFLVVKIAGLMAQVAPIHLDVPRLIKISIVFVFVEEVLFRGLLQTRLEVVLGAPRAWLISGLIFGLNHLYQLYLIPGKQITLEIAFQLLYLTAFGWLLGIVFAKTRSLLPGFLLHALNNLPL